MLVVAAALAAAAAALWALAFRTGAGSRADQAVLGGFLGLGEPPVHTLATAAVRLADPLPVVLATAVLMCVALARRCPRLAVTVLAVVAAANVSTQALKRLTAEPRPVEALSANVAPASWPSGHATAAMAVALCLVVVSPVRLRLLASVAGGAFAMGVGYAVMLLGWHFASDVIAGFCVATAWTLIGVAALRAPVMVPKRLFAVASTGLVVLTVVIAATMSETDPAQVYVRPDAAFVAAAAVIGVKAFLPTVGLALTQSNRH